MIKFYLTNAYLADISAHSFSMKLSLLPPSTSSRNRPTPDSSSLTFTLSPSSQLGSLNRPEPISSSFSPPQREFSVSNPASPSAAF